MDQPVDDAPVQLFDTPYIPSVPLCSLKLPLAAIAARWGFTPVAYEQDGLGPATGFICRLPDGMLVITEELEYTIETGRMRGPTLFVEIGHVRTLGLAAAMQAALCQLGISRDDADWVQTEAGAQRWPG